MRYFNAVLILNSYKIYAGQTFTILTAKKDFIRQQGDGFLFF